MMSKSPGLRSVVQSDSERFLWIPVPNDERQQEHGSRVKHSQVTCTSERRSGLSMHFDDVDA